MLLPIFSIKEISKSISDRREAELEPIIKKLARNPMPKPTKKIKFLRNNVKFSSETLRELVRTGGSAVMASSRMGTWGSIFFDKGTSIPLVDHELLSDYAKRELKAFQLADGFIDVT